MRAFIRSVALLILNLFTCFILADPPEASSVEIQNAMPYSTGDVLNGTFVYNDNDNDGEGEHVFKWYIATSESGAGASVIIGETSQSYTIQSGDEGFYIAFEVTPYDTTDESPGTPVMSSWGLVNNKPVAVSDIYPLAEGANLSISAPGVLNNDNDADEHTVYSNLVTSPSHAASFSLNTNGSFSYTHDASETTSDNFSYIISDDYDQGNEVLVTLSITPQNDQPVLDNIETATLNFTEGGNALNITSTITVSDNDDTHLDSATISITSGYTGSEDILSYNPVSGITGSYNTVSGVYSLKGTALLSAYQSALRNIRYQNTNASNPSTTNRIVSFRVYDGEDWSNSEARTISISADNDSPVLDNIETASLNFTEGGSALNITSTITVSDNDDTHLDSATISITSGYTGSEDILSYNPVSGITGSYNTVSGVYSLKGKALVSAYQSALRNIRYQNTNTSNPSTTNRIVSFRVYDGEDWSNSEARTISISADNDSPVLDNIETTALNFTEGGSALNITSSITVSDNDDTHLDSATISITTGYTGSEDVLSYNPVSGITGSYNAISGVYSLKGTALLSAYQSALQNIKYQNTNTSNPSTTNRIITFRVYDGEDWSNSEARTINILLSNDSPVLDNIETASLNFTEGGSALNITSTITVSDNDDTHLDSATISITTGYTGSEDVLGYNPVSGITGSYNAVSGVYSLRGTALLSAYQSALRNIRYQNINISNPSTTDRVITFRAYDGEDWSNNETRIIKVIAENDEPVVSEVTILGDMNLSETISGNYTFVDPDGDDEGNSSFRWMRANDISGSGSNSIPNATRISYEITKIDEGRYLQFQVTPADEYGLTGEMGVSNWQYVNRTPQADNLIVEGIRAVGETITAEFDYYDVEGDPEGTHIIEWYRADNASGEGSISIASGNTYLLTGAENEKWISFTVTPVAVSGSTPGTVVQSLWYPVTTLPTAVIHGDTTICDNGSAGILTIELTGTAPWEVYYKINDLPGNLLNITKSPYLLSASEAGNYTLISVTDVNEYSGSVSGTGKISHYPVPTAGMSGDVAVCKGLSDSIPVTLTGIAPWTINYTYNGSLVTVSDIPSSVHRIKVNSTLSGTYELIQVSDAHCSGTAVGTVNVAEKKNPSGFIYGSTMICPGEDTVAFINLTGNSPWTVKYSHNSVYKQTITVTENTYKLPVSEAGVYELISVTDNSDNGEGCISGLATISNYSLPEAKLTGDVHFCEGTEATVPVILTGDPLFSFVYKTGSGPNDTIKNISSSPYHLSVSSPGNVVLNLLSVSDQHCSAIVSGRINIIQDAAPLVEILDLEDVYSSEIDQVHFRYKPVGGNFSDTKRPPTIYVDYTNGNALFLPKASGADNSPHTLIYKVQGINGCWGRDSVVISVLDSLGQIDILHEKPVFCYNDPPITVIGANIEKSTGSFSIEGGVGLTDLGNNTAIIDPSLINSDSRWIYYEFEAGGTIVSVEREIYFEQLTSDFKWNNECFTEDTGINFEGLGVSDYDLVNFIWDFYLPDTVITLTGKNTEFVFKKTGTYQIDYIIESENGCRDTATKMYSMQPTIVVSDEPYFENFESGSGLWVAKKTGTEGPLSWTLGTPEQSIMNAQEGVDAWYTKITDRSLIENSYVESPCFSFVNIDKPVIKMDVWRVFDLKRDGAVLQYSLNDGNNWINIGKLDDGIEWYNSYQIEGLPGGQQVGWTDKVDNNWIEVRHDLDILAGNQAVKLRIAYGSDGTGISNEGFAFDNIHISNRKKRVLFEHFTNSGNDLCTEADNLLNSLVSSMNQDIIDIQYHTAFPQGDPYYLLNPDVPNSRELYYYLEDIPYGLIDGGRENKSSYKFDFKVRIPDELIVKRAMLEDNLFDIDIDAKNSMGSIIIETKLTALDSIQEALITLHHVIIERIAEEEEDGGIHAESVAKDMLPNTFGTEYQKSWVPGESSVVNFIWPHTNVFDEEKLRVVAFVQDESTKRVYQAAISYLDENITGNKQTLYTGLEAFHIYPNPSQGKIWIYFDMLPEDDIRVEVFDNNLRRIYESDFSEVKHNLFFTLKNTRPGIYYIRINSKEKVYQFQKLIITESE